MGLFGSSGVSFTASKDLPSLAGKTILVTGGNAGLGKQSVHDLAKYGKPAKIFLAARSLQKAQSAIDEIKQDVPDANIVSLQLDLTSFDSINAAARTFLSQSDSLDILMLNAGIMATPPGQTKEGYEIQFGTNHMGHFLLTKLLLPVLRATVARPDDKPADVRIVVLSSAGIGLAPASGFDDSWVRTDGSAVSTLTRYGQSKLANALMARELARRYPEITSIAVHPGTVNTGLADAFQDSGVLQNILLMVVRPFLATPEMGARNQLWAAVSGDVKNGEYYMPVGAVGWGRGTANARDDELARKVWEWTEGELKGQEI
ncbi:short-chain dehydrogenase/reductase [Coniochaeta sp. 2T2.1]|nr:short-chain dehydrogenase/reductase [Coniochaeta sp. 2T2.1]